MNPLDFIFKERSFTYKFMAFPMILIAGTAIFFSYTILSYEKRELMEKEKKQNTLLTNFAVFSLSNELVFFNKSLIDKIVDILIEEDHVDYAIVIDTSNNRILSHSDHLKDGRLYNEVMNAQEKASIQKNGSDIEPVANLHDHAIDQKRSDSNENNQPDMYEHSAEIQIGGETYGILKIGFSMVEVNREIAKLMAFVLTSIVVFAGTGMIFTYALVLLISNPISELAKRAKCIGKGDFDHQVIYSGKDILGDLVVGFNEMAHDLKCKNRQVMNMNQSLRVERDKCRTILNSIGESIYIVDEEYVVEFQNTVSINQFGYAMGKPCYEIFWKKERPCSFCRMSSSIHDNQVRQLEIDVDQYYFDIIFSPFEASEGKVKSTVIIRDVTERKNMEAETIRAGHLASLGELAAGVAHEINNPVTGIITIAEILADQFQDMGGDRQIPERIVNEGERIGKIVKNLLSFARDKKENMSPVLIDDILKLTLELVEKQISKDGICLMVRMPSENLIVNARTQELQQVFLNLISNARYALTARYPGPHENKILEIVGETIHEKDQPHVRITFHDRGTGIPEAHFQRVLNPFFSTKPQGEGTGLGLSISHGIIKKHGGALKFESKKGEFTKMMVELPIYYLGAL